MIKKLKKALHMGEFRLLGYQLRWNITRSTHRKIFDNSFFDTPYRIHLGPGPNWRKPSSNWIDVDVDPERGDLQVDFQNFEGFPLESETVECIYGSHVFEHMSIWVTDGVFEECYRVLAPNGVLRIVIPDVEKSINEYVKGNEKFSLFERRRRRALEKFNREYTLFDCLREDFLSKSSQLKLLGENALAHQNAWDYESLMTDLKRAGFSHVERSEFRSSNSEHMSFEGSYPSEANETERSLYVEAIKKPIIQD